MISKPQKPVYLPYGLRDGHMMHVLTVENGLACGCICPGCGARLVARNRGEKKVPHFAHHNAPECAYGLESALHLAAKDIFLQHQTFCLPGVAGELPWPDGYWESFAFDARQYLNRVPCEVYEENLYDFPSRYVRIHGVELERRTHDIVPDLILQTDNGPLLVEIAVTHFIDEAKMAKLRLLGLPVVEIDLSRAARDLDGASLEQLLIHQTQHKRWAFNAKLDARLAQRQYRYGELLRPHFERLHTARLQGEQEAARQLQQRQQLKTYYNTQTRPITVRELNQAEAGNMAKHVDSCPLKPRSYMGQSYANVEADCIRSCRHFRGYGAERKSVVCLYDYDTRKRRN